MQKTSSKPSPASDLPKTNLWGFFPSAWAPLLLCGWTLILLNACKKEEAPSQITSVTAKPTPPATRETSPVLVSAEPNSFDEVTAQLDRGGSFYAYVSTEKWLADLTSQLGNWHNFLQSTSGAATPLDQKTYQSLIKFADNLYTHSGVQHSTGVGASSFAIAPKVSRDKLFVHHRTGQGDRPFWSAFGKTPQTLSALDFLPPHTAIAGFANCDANAIVAFLQKEVAQSDIPEAKTTLEKALLQFSTELGLSLQDALGSLADSVGIIITLDSDKPIALPIPDQKVSFPAPQVALLFQVKSERIFRQMDKLIESHDHLTKIDQADLHLRILPPLNDLPLEVCPTIAQWGGYLIVATGEKIVREIIAAKTTGQGFKNTSEFSQIASGLPKMGNGFFIATALAGNQVVRLQKEMIATQPSTTPAQLTLVKKLLEANKSHSFYTVISHLPNGWLAINQSIQLESPTSSTPANSVATSPMVTSLRSKAQAAASLSHARQIAMACKLYADDHGGKFPPSLQGLVPDYLPNVATFVSPFAPSEPIGYVYHPNANSLADPKTVLLEDQFSIRENYLIEVDSGGNGKFRLSK